VTDDQIRDIAAKEPSESSLSIGRVIALVGLALFVAFIIQNTQDSDVRFLWMDIQLPVWMVAVLIFVIGALVGYYSKVRKVKAQRKALK